MDSSRGDPIDFEFAILGEFSEIEGPVARVVSLPAAVAAGLPPDEAASSANLGDRVVSSPALQRFDLDAFVLRIMSVDVSHTRDWYTTLELPGEGLSAYVLHVALLDLHARGYVRPLALAFVTPHGASKICAALPLLHAHLETISTQLKRHNHALFASDLSRRLQDLHATAQYLSASGAAPRTDAESLAPTPNSVRESIEELQQLRAQVLGQAVASPDALPSLSPQAPEDAYTPAVLASLQRGYRFNEKLRSLSELCGEDWGQVVSGMQRLVDGLAFSTLDLLEALRTLPMARSYSALTLGGAPLCDFNLLESTWMSPLSYPPSTPSIPSRHDAVQSSDGDVDSDAYTSPESGELPTPRAEERPDIVKPSNTSELLERFEYRSAAMADISARQAAWWFRSLKWKCAASLIHSVLTARTLVIKAPAQMSSAAVYLSRALSTFILLPAHQPLSSAIEYWKPTAVTVQDALLRRILVVSSTVALPPAVLRLASVFSFEDLSFVGPLSSNNGLANQLLALDKSFPDNESYHDYCWSLLYEFSTRCIYYFHGVLVPSSSFGHRLYPKASKRSVSPQEASSNATFDSIRERCEASKSFLSKQASLSSESRLIEVWISTLLRGLTKGNPSTSSHISLQAPPNLTEIREASSPYSFLNTEPPFSTAGLQRADVDFKLVF